MSKRKRYGLAAGGVGLLIALALAAWLRAVYLGRPPGLLKDLRAGLAARQIEDPDARLLAYLEGRYGTQADPANRRRVFLDFFEPERIEVLQMLVQRAPEKHRQASIDAMARWVARYRDSLSPEERAELGARFRTPEGRAQLGRATAQYNAQDVHYRGQTAPVISELLRTLHEVGPTP